MGRFTMGNKKKEGKQKKHKTVDITTETRLLLRQTKVG